jgi:hypothetical protein
MPTFAPTEREDLLALALTKEVDVCVAVAEVAGVVKVEANTVETDAAYESGELIDEIGRLILDESSVVDIPRSTGPKWLFASLIARAKMRLILKKLPIAPANKTHTQE